MTSEEAGRLLERYGRLMAHTCYGAHNRDIAGCKRFELIALHGDCWFADVAVATRLKDTCDAIERKLGRDGQIATIKRYVNTGDAV